ncbi:MAG: EAL domain-containing protein, partial [Acidobacteriota bacterium]
PPRCARRHGSSLKLSSPEISGQHAELTSRDGFLWVRDLSSKNGSFLNEERIEMEVRLAAGDLLRFANREFRLVSAHESTQGLGSVTQTVALPSSLTPSNLAKRLAVMREILEHQSLVAHFQPIVDFATGHIVAFEALGRGVHGDEMVSPGELFELASGLSREADLSRSMRRQAVIDGHAIDPPVLFVNTHPAELVGGAQRLLTSLANLRRSAPDRRLVLEIHEAAVATPELLMEVGRGVVELEIELAFDDFGTGQARLLELVEVAPRYLKFDRAWISGIDRATPHRLEMLSRLVSMVKSLGVLTLAEGVENAEEAETCIQVGFELAQGYHFGRPSPAGSWNVA